MSPRASTLNLREIPGKITNGVYSKALPAKIAGVIERTVRKVPTAPNTDHVSLKFIRFGFLGVHRISREAVVAIKTAISGLMEIMVSTVSIGIKRSNLSVQ